MVRQAPWPLSQFLQDPQLTLNGTHTMSPAWTRRTASPTSTTSRGFVAEHLPSLDAGASFVHVQVEPQMFVLVIRTSTSVGSSIRDPARPRRGRRADHDRRVLSYEPPLGRMRNPAVRRRVPRVPPASVLRSGQGVEAAHATRTCPVSVRMPSEPIEVRSVSSRAVTFRLPFG